MISSRSKNIIKSKISRYGTTYKFENGDAFKGILTKADVSRDQPRHEHVVLISYNATINNGETILTTDDSEIYIPVQTESQDAVNSVAYNRIFLMKANASGDIKTYIDPANASKDAWAVPTGVEGTDYGWVIKKHGVNFCFDNKGLTSRITDIGAIETSRYDVYIPWSINASYTPVAEDRIIDRNNKAWKIEDIDNISNINQAYIARVSPDER
jgi:hypothetical protein